MLTNEITVNTDHETEYAKPYTLALQALRKKLEQQKRTQIMRKERAKDKAKLATKDPSKMSVMEKLQLQASTQVVDFEGDIQDPKKNQKNYQKDKWIDRKKFNASAGKHKQIQK